MGADSSPTGLATLRRVKYPVCGWYSLLCRYSRRSKGWAALQTRRSPGLAIPSQSGAEVVHRAKSRRRSHKLGGGRESGSRGRAADGY